MSTRGRKKAGVIAMFLALMMVFSITSVYAGEDGSLELQGNSLTIEGYHKVKNKEDLKTGRHTFVLTADKESNPMPEGSENGVKKVTISSGERFSFGPIAFVKPGIYEYTVSREIIPSETLKQDDSKYKVKIAIYSDETSTIVYEKSESSGKPDIIEYVDTYVPPKSDEDSDDAVTNAINKIVKTGDNAPVMIMICLFAAALIVLAVIAVRRKRGAKKE